MRFHSNINNVSFACSIDGCCSSLVSYNALRMHVLRNHNVTRCPKIMLDNMRLLCSLPACGTVSTNLKDHLSHLKTHIAIGTFIACPFKQCTKEFNKKSSFTSHLSRNHVNWGHTLIKEFDVESVGNETKNIDGNMPTEMDTGSEFERTLMNTEVEKEIARDCETMKTEFTTNIALFYLKLQAKYLLAESKIQEIVDEFVSIHNFGQSLMKDTLFEKLQTVGLSVEQSQQMIEELEKSDLLKSSFSEGIFKSSYSRKTYYKNSFNFVSPEEVYLGRDDCQNHRYYQYVSIKESLKIILNYKSFKVQYLQQQRFQPDPNIMEDITDGSAFKSNSYFTVNNKALKLILYQDSFEVVNPLGSAKTKHKILAVYYTLADILPHYRSNIDHIQLILLCREVDFKVFGQFAIFHRLIADLKDLQLNGITLSGDVIKASVVAIAGDNLGSHIIGGFSENFGSGNYFCRYCLIERSEFKDHPFETGIPRNSENYNNDVEFLKSNTELVQYHGVKFASCFNELEFFHVCSPGLPPCLGHDLFEGVVSFDLALFLKYFVSKMKWFTFQHFNRLLSKFKCLGSDAGNKPAPIKVNGERLGGHAVQNWCFIRILPIVVGHRIKDLENPVWRLCLLLQEIVEIVCAQKISLAQVAYLRCLIEEYLEGRNSIFPDVTMKPKHHFLAHYPGLILKFGPLIRLWTMRFEAKHSYFKRCARVGQNFTNLCKSLAEKHQLLQAYFSMGELFPPILQCSNGHNLSIDLYNSDIKNAIKATNLIVEKCMMYDDITFKGTNYRAGLFIALRNTEYGVVFGKILFFIISDIGDVILVVETYQSHHDDRWHVYVLENRPIKTECFKLIDALDYYPLPCYAFLNSKVIVLHHAISDCRDGY